MSERQLLYLMKRTLINFYVWTCTVYNYDGSLALISWVVSEVHCYYICEGGSYCRLRHYRVSWQGRANHQVLLCQECVDEWIILFFKGDRVPHNITAFSLSLPLFSHSVITQPYPGPFSAISGSFDLLGPLTFWHPWQRLLQAFKGYCYEDMTDHWPHGSCSVGTAQGQAQVKLKQLCHSHVPVLDDAAFNVQDVTEQSEFMFINMCVVHIRWTTAGLKRAFWTAFYQ